MPSSTRTPVPVVSRPKLVFSTTSRPAPEVTSEKPDLYSGHFLVIVKDGKLVDKITLTAAELRLVSTFREESAFSRSQLLDFAEKRTQQISRSATPSLCLVEQLTMNELIEPGAQQLEVDQTVMASAKAIRSANEQILSLTGGVQ